METPQTLRQSLNRAPIPRKLTSRADSTERQFMSDETLGGGWNIRGGYGVSIKGADRRTSV
jgi:hypothetical protein